MPPWRGPTATQAGTARRRSARRRGSVRSRRPAVTLIELLLSLGLLAVLSALTMPVLLERFQKEHALHSARNLQSLIALVRAHAQFDGVRYRIRFLSEDERDEEGIVDERQPVIERENDPIRDPDNFERVSASWAHGKTFLGAVWCMEIRPGKPTVEDIKRRREHHSEIADTVRGAREDIDPLRPPIVVEPDGTCPWATFVLTEAPRETDFEELQELPRLELVLDGMTGLAWVQRPFYDEELDLFEEKHWPAAIRQDLLTARVLTEDDVLELHERRIMPAEQLALETGP